MSESRRYHNLSGVVRDLEHARGPDSTAEGRDLLDRWRDLAAEASEIASSLDADDESEESDDPDDVDDTRLGDEGPAGSRPHAGRPGVDAAGSDALLSGLARLDRVLAALEGRESTVQSGAAPVDAARGEPAVKTARLTKMPSKVGDSGEGKKQTKRSRSKR